ncbi:hypothetical protein ACJMK2_010987 [Sinanodonta woodiana]|uniref:Kazal-like domain-containing protein n=1 Tax=Sinanodonta woodiana TaxID=1069815 RepID=A0ABD3V6N4_SINWO
MEPNLHSSRKWETVWWAIVELLVFIILVSDVTDHFTNCNWVLHHSCDTYGHSQQCGTDGFTYDNRCLFAKAYCRDTSLHVAHDGPCINVGTSVKPTDTAISGSTNPPMYSGSEAVLDFFCTYLSHEICTSTKDEICGSDNVTYINPCEFEKERCSHRYLHAQYFGPC